MFGKAYFPGGLVSEFLSIWNVLVKFLKTKYHTQLEQRHSIPFTVELGFLIEHFRGGR